MSRASVKQSLTVVVLEKYFDEVVILGAYLRGLVSPMSREALQTDADDFLLKIGDEEAYRELLNTSYVGLKLPIAGTGPHFTAVAPMMYMRDVIQKAHERIFLTSRTRPNNIIASGYQRAAGNNKRNDRSASGITNRFVNTIVTALQASQWEVLLQRIGADAMLHLLLNTSVFISLPNECLCQVTGEPLIHIPPPEGGFLTAVPLRPSKRKRESPTEMRPRKRLKLVRENSGIRPTIKGSTRQTRIQTMERRTAADISFVRTRLFYARPSRDPDSFRIVVGLPYNHVLNTLNPSYYRKPRSDPATYHDPDPREQAKHARHLSKYVFPLQYALSNVFCYVSNTRGVQHQPNYVDREHEIKVAGSCNTPKRLRDILPLLEKMIWRHGKCGYKPLRDKVCPSKLTTSDKATLDSTVILDMVSENSFHIQSQLQPRSGDMSIDSAGNSILPQGLSQSKKYGANKPRFVEFACSHVEVFRYVLLVTKVVIPKQFWGCKKNFGVVQSYVKEFVTMRRHETSSLHNVLQGFSTAECDWLIPPGIGAQTQARISVTDSLKRRELLEEFMFWYFDSFVLPLLKTTFYVTDSSAFRNQVLYFRHDDWETLCTPLIDQLSEKTFQEIERHEAEEILRQRQLGFSFVRLLPKETGVRPIVNLRRRTNQRKGPYVGPEKSINQILQATFQILKYEKQCRPELLGASVFGPNEIYTRLKTYKTRLLESSPSGELPKLYFVKVDVQACFDTIEQSTLLKILHQLISEDNYLIQRYGQVTPVVGKIKRVYERKAYPDDEHPDFIAYARTLAQALRQAIFVDQVHYNFQSRRTAMQLLEEHISENLVKIGSRYYRQVVGIPQGSVLSALLCSYCYGDLEGQKFGRLGFTNDPQCLLMRLIDDYLFVTTSEGKARAFLDMMNQGHPEYGCIISKEKTMTNFDYEIEIMNVIHPDQKHFPWCGLLIDMGDLSVLADYTRYRNTDLKDTLTVDKGRRPGVTFVHKMLQLVKARSHIIYFDAGLNGQHIVCQNIYQNFLVTAAKMHHYLASWGTEINKNTTFIYKTIRQVICYSYTTIAQKSSGKVSRACGGRCDVPKAHVIWLGTHAFHAVLSRKPEKYASSVLKPLAFELSLPRNRRIRCRLRGVVKESASIMLSLGI